jgi:hypothetical protein
MEVANGQVVSQERVAPGRLDLKNLPLTMGRNDARVVVRDAFGQTQELSSTYYLTTTALAQGVHDYQYNVGFRRFGVGDTNWDYRTPVLLARHRVGVTDSFTAGGRVELHPGRLFSGGPTVNLRLPFGEVETAGSVSRRREQWGSAALASFTYSGRPVSAGGSMMVASPRYATLSPNPINEDPRRQGSVFASVAVSSAVSVTAQHTQTKLYQGISRDRSGLLTSVHLSRNVELIASVAKTTDERGAGREAYAGVTVLFGRAVGPAAHVRLARQPVCPRSAAANAGRHRLRLSGARRGRTECQRERRRAVSGNARPLRAPPGNDWLESMTTFSTMGALAGIGGGVFATRPVEEAPRRARAGVEGVRAFASHQEIGKTAAATS